MLAWPTIHRYSEEIFTRVAVGHLPHGWCDKAGINAVRIEIIAMAGNAPAPATPDAAHAEAGHRQQKAPDGKGAYDRAKNGTPALHGTMTLTPAPMQVRATPMALACRGCRISAGTAPMCAG